MWQPIARILLGYQWSFTLPVSGSFFRLKFLQLPAIAEIEICQAENINGFYQISDIQNLRPLALPQILEFEQPIVMGERCLGLRKRGEESLALEVELEVSRQPSLDLKHSIEAVQENITEIFKEQVGTTNTLLSALAKQLTSMEAKINLLSSSSTGSNSQTTAPRGKSLSFVSAGDTNGVFYWLGTQQLTQDYVNPGTNGTLVFSSSSSLASTTQAFNLADRGSAVAHTNDEANAFFQVDLLANRSLVLTCYTFKGRDDSAGTNYHHPRNWKFQGSNDASTWTDLDTQTNNATIDSKVWFTKQVLNQSIGYRYFRFLQTGPNSTGAYYLTGGEMELYGTLNNA